ncbi:MAG: porin family protein [Bacteroidetes bacterium]|nr:porin family protein [Bacteroidota bacterium]
MKKIIIATIALLSVAVSNEAHAQKGLSFSIKGTPSATWMNNADDKDNNVIEFSPMLGVSFGVGAEYQITNNIGVALDALYSLQGRSFEAAGLERNQKVNYFKVAPMFTYTYPLNNIVSFVGKVGPQVSILTDSKLTDNDGNSIKSDMNEEYESIAMGGVANLGAQFNLTKNWSLTTAIRYDMDFTNAEKEDFILHKSGRSTTLNSTAGLELGLKYRL